MSEDAKQEKAIHAEMHLQYTIDGSSAVLADRRRPGRLGNVSPHLLPLLRRSERKLELLDPEAEESLDALLDGGDLIGSTSVHDEPAYRDDRLPDGSGVVIAVAGGTLIWGLIIAAVLIVF